MKPIKRYQPALLLAILLFTNSFNVNAQKKGRPLPKDQALTLDPEVRTGKLANGFTYFIRHNEEPKNRVLMYLVNKVGSILEDEDQRGLAHFIEHMSFNGTVHFPHNQLVNYLQKAGVRFGADINAYTAFDETVYQLPLPTDQPKVLTQGLMIMHDWAQGATLEQGEIDKERGVILEEARLGRGAEERMQRLYWPVILNNSRYSYRMPIGLEEVINNFKRPAIERFYRDWYRPNLQALIIVGDINVDSMEHELKAQFSDLKNPAQEKPRPNYSVPLTGKNQFKVVTDREMTSTQAEVLIKHPEAPLKTETDYRKAIILNLFNQMLGSRYAELSRGANPLLISGSAGISPFVAGRSVFDVNLEAKSGELETGFKAVWREVERLKRFGFTATELARTKASYLNGMENALKEKDKTPSAAYLGEYQTYFLKGTAAPGIVKEVQLVREAMPTITLKEVNTLTQAYVKATDQDILILAPEKDKALLPNEKAVRGWMAAVHNESLKPYDDNVSDLQLLSKAPSPGKIKSEQRNDQLGLTTLVLDNGVRVILKPTNFKNNEIQLSAFAPGGTSLVSDADFQSAAAATGIVTGAGAGNYNLNQLNKFLEGKDFNVSPYLTERFEGFSGGATPKSLENALQLIYAYFTEPRKDATVFNGMIDRFKANLANRDKSPASVFSDTVSAVLNNYNIRRTGPSLKKISEIDLEKAYRIYKDRFSDASGFTFTFVGNIDTAAIKPLLEKYLGGLPSTGRGEQAKDLNIHIPEGKMEKIVHRGSESMATVMLVYSGKFDYSQEYKIKLDAMEEALNIRLLERLREEESGVYSPSVRASASKLPQSRYNVVIQFGCAPKNVDKLVASAIDEINKLKTNGPLAENIDKWRAEAKNSWEPQLKTNGFWVQYLNTQLQNGEDLNQFSKYHILLDQVTSENIRELAAYCLSGQNFIKLILLPE